jgi:poly(3-hydroxybutyrate) depolymerase
MTANQRRLLTVAAAAVAAYCAAAYPLGLHSPLDSLTLPAGTESKTLEFGGRTRTYLIHRSFNDVPATDIMWSFFAAHPKP